MLHRNAPRRGPRIEAMGLSFRGPLGLAAGFDKNAEAVESLGALGFSFVEVGTITPKPQPGNPKPRLFRLVKDKALINRMGFNNDGVHLVAQRLEKLKRGTDLVVGVNIGKNAATPVENATDDYCAAARMVAEVADYLVVNVSSPNTPSLRNMQHISQLRPLLVAVRETLDSSTDRHVPLLVKISPDLSNDDVRAIAELANELDLDGVVAANTTTSREGLVTDDSVVEACGAGGLSGPPLVDRSTEILQFLRNWCKKDITLISVGGIQSSTDVISRLEAGASLVQAYTGFVYGGPSWPRTVQRAVMGEIAENAGF